MDPLEVMGLGEMTPGAARREILRRIAGALNRKGREPSLAMSLPQ